LVFAKKIKNNISQGNKFEFRHQGNFQFAGIGLGKTAKNLIKKLA
jgi:hypothetical protein